MELDRRMTFDTYVVGPANRLATAAARRAADSPGTSYNPLFLYSASGLGKSHILTAVAQHATRTKPERKVVYQSLEGYLDELTQSLGSGDKDGMRDRYRDLEILLLDDVQFLTGQTQAQELLLRTLDTLAAQGSQVVLASDRPPAEINGLDARLLSRFSGGLIVDIGTPDYETRVAIMRRKVEERSARLLPGVAEAMARHPYKNVRELQGALNRVLAVQDLEDRQVAPDEVYGILGVGDAGRADEGKPEPQPVVPEVEEEPEPEPETWRQTLQKEASVAEEEGYSAARLHRLLAADVEPEDLEGVVRRFRRDVERLQEIGAALIELGSPSSDADQTVLEDPERLEEAEALLASARERRRPFPEIGNGPVLSELTGRYPPLALRAAERFVLQERPEYNPLYVVCSERVGANDLLRATGRTLLGIRPNARVALVSVQEFAEDFIRAISEGVAGAWRERWWSVDLFLLSGAEALSDTERAQDEFFHLFEALKGQDARILITADCPPSEIEKIDDRLRSRFEGGLVVEVDGLEVTDTGGGEVELEVRGSAAGEGTVAEVEEHDRGKDPAPATAGVETVVPDVPVPPTGVVGDGTGKPRSGTHSDDLALIREIAGVGARATRKPDEEGSVVAEGSSAKGPDGEEVWRPNPEKVVWRWPRLADVLEEDD